MRSRFSTHHRRARGQNLVEFALVVPVFLLFLFGTLEFGWLLYVDHQVTNAAREGARWAAVHGTRCEAAPPCTLATTELVRQQILDRVRLPDPDALGVTLQVVDDANANGKPDPDERVRVQVSYPFRPLIGYALPVTEVNLSANSTMRVHY
uniref:Pilus assembly protein n=1 Tax=Thermorudis sp. TaxID=1969470 RepID=A0A7C2WJA4_9BACT